MFEFLTKDVFGVGILSVLLCFVFGMTFVIIRALRERAKRKKQEEKFLGNLTEEQKQANKTNLLQPTNKPNQENQTEQNLKTDEPKND